MHGMISAGWLDGKSPFSSSYHSVDCPASAGGLGCNLPALSRELTENQTLKACAEERFWMPSPTEDPWIVKYDRARD
jgi:hypothetical protein